MAISNHTEQHNGTGAPHSAKSADRVTLARRIHQDVSAALRAVEACELEESRYGLETTAAVAHTLRGLLEGGDGEEIPAADARPAGSSAGAENETTASREAPPYEAAAELRAMCDMLVAGATGDVTLFDGSLERYAEAMIEKVNIVCSWFKRGGESEEDVSPETHDGAVSSLAKRPPGVDAVELAAAHLESINGVLELLMPELQDHKRFGSLCVIDREQRRILAALNDIAGELLESPPVAA